MMKRLFKKLGDKVGIYDEDLTPFKHYDPPENQKLLFNLPVGHNGEII